MSNSTASAMVEIRSAVRSELAKCDAGDVVIVACSGGADSLALSYAVCKEAEKLAVMVVGITIDHQLQSESGNQAKSVVEQFASMGISTSEIIRVTVEVTDGMEASARRVRYQALDRAADKYGAQLIFLGHTRDDQAETVLLGLARGSGTRSLSGMAPLMGRYVRPLLGITREQTEAACRQRRLKAWQDPHNQHRQYLRVRARMDALPALEKTIGPGIGAALARSAALLRDDADALDEWAKREFQDFGGESIDISRLASLPRGVRTRVIRIGIYGAGAPPGSVTADHIGAVESLVTSWHGQGEVSLPGGVKARRLSGRLSLLPPDNVSQQNKKMRGTVDHSAIGNDIEKIVVTEEQLKAKVKELASRIEVDYRDRDLLMVGVLKGAIMAMADLSRALQRHVEMDWMAVSSYGSGTKSSGVVRILKDLDRDITGREVLIVEDIVDSGLTLSWLKANLESRGAKSVEVLAILRKPEAAKVDVKVKYVGFEIPTDFVVGYGLDFNEKYRNLAFVGVLAKHIYS